MTDLSALAITKRWPAEHPDRLQLYSLPTPNGVKVSIMLEETGLPYEVHLVDFGKGDQRTPEYLSLNPYGKIPAIIDPAGPGGKPLPLFESGAILLYLAEKTGKFLPADAAGRYETLEWLFFQMAAMGPMFGQVGYFHKFAGREIEDKRPLRRYRDEAKRILAVIEARLAARSCNTLPRRPESFSQRTRHDAIRPSSGCTSRCRRSGRCSVRSASFISLPARRSPTSVRWNVTSTNRNACLAFWSSA
jgi:GST-like protein